jgi:hypothetical protein
MTAHHIDGQLAFSPTGHRDRGPALSPRGDDGTTVIHGAVTDQAALHGLFRKLRDIGVPILSVVRTDEPPADPANQHVRRSTT